jgi:hypothetical protein
VKIRSLFGLKSPFLVPALQQNFSPQRRTGQKRRLRRGRKFFALAKNTGLAFWRRGTARGKL